jgi:hypothetical protein
MRPKRRLIAIGLTVAAMTAVSAGPAAAAPLPGPFQASGPFHAVLQVFPHNPEAAQRIFTKAATRDPETALAFFRHFAGESAVPTCPGGDIANCKLEDFLNEPL